MDFGKKIGVFIVSCFKIKCSNYLEIKYFVINVGGFIGYFLF